MRWPENYSWFKEEFGSVIDFFRSSSQQFCGTFIRPSPRSVFEIAYGQRLDSREAERARMHDNNEARDSH